MILKRKQKGRMISEITVGEKITFTERIDEKTLFIYLGLTDDVNPLYIHSDYTVKTTYKKPIIPSMLLMGIVSSTISKYLPGPGSYILSHNVSFPQPTYHHDLITFSIEVERINIEKENVLLNVKGLNEKNVSVLEGTVVVIPPKIIPQKAGRHLENF